jgi:hypothetical protein
MEVYEEETGSTVEEKEQAQFRRRKQAADKYTKRNRHSKEGEGTGRIEVQEEVVEVRRRE